MWPRVRVAQQLGGTGLGVAGGNADARADHVLIAIEYDRLLQRTRQLAGDAGGSRLGGKLLAQRRELVTAEVRPPRPRARCPPPTTPTLREKLRTRPLIGPAR